MAGILLNRLRVYQEAAEKAAMQQTAAAIKSALQMRVAAYMINGRDNDIEHLRSENPVNWLQERPQNYAGEFYADAYARVAPGSWYFDLSHREMIYVINLGHYFKRGAGRAQMGALPGKNRIRRAAAEGRPAAQSAQCSQLCADPTLRLVLVPMSACQFMCRARRKSAQRVAKGHWIGPNCTL